MKTGINGGASPVTRDKAGVGRGSTSCSVTQSTRVRRAREIRWLRAEDGKGGPGGQSTGRAEQSPPGPSTGKCADGDTSTTAYEQ